MAVAERKITGWHVAAIFVGAFGVIIGVNITLAVKAVKTFPGLETKNSYVASQSFDARRGPQEALGWEVSADAHEGKVILTITDAQGSPVQVTGMEAVLGRATHVKDDMTPEFSFNGREYVAYADITPGNWNVRMTAQSLDGTPFEQRVILHVD